METPSRSFVSLLRQILVWLARSAAALTAFGIALVTILLLVMWIEHRTEITLPTPTGSFAVGRATYAWTNEAQTEEFAAAPNSKRQLLVWIWYPATRLQSSTRAPYLPAQWRTALADRLGLLMRSFFKRDPALVHGHSSSDASVSPKQGAYPIVLLRAGGSALTTDFTTLAEDLASHGFFVVGFDAPHRSFVVVLPDGRIITRRPEYNVENANGNLADPLVGKLLQMWTSDTAFVVDQLQRLNNDSSAKFAGRMDFQRLGMFGHSFGGATALEFCHEDARCKAALDMDGIPFGRVVNEGLNKAGMFLLSDHNSEMADPESHVVLAEIQSIYQRLPDGRRWYLVIKRANHFSFSDQILLNSPIAMKLLSLVRFGGLDTRRGLAITADYVHNFFNVSLNGAPAASLTNLAAKYPEVQIEGQKARPSSE